jgi:peptidoglycan/xylan/chitin deacetylase (PgdA/CDA1 family)
MNSKTGRGTKIIRVKWIGHSKNNNPAISMLRYGPEVGVPRILETYKQLDIQQTFFVPAWCIENYPSVVKAMIDSGHEVAHHGFLHEL